MASGGEILIDELIKYGASLGFCVPGESYLGALDALYDRQQQFRLITCRQEGGAAYMAAAWGRLHDQPGICFVSRGPGAANAMVGIHTAFQDSTPLLCLIGQISRIDRGREAFQELDYQKVYAGVAKQVVVIDNASRIPEQLAHAWHCALSGRPGPVIVVLYEDLLKDQVASERLTQIVKPPGKNFAAAPAQVAVEQIARLSKHAQRPLIIGGGSMWNCRTNALLTQLTEATKIPVATAFRRQDSIDNNHPHYIGEFGLVAPPATARYLQQADLLLVIGARLGDITTHGYQCPPPDSGFEGQTLVHVLPDADGLNVVYRSHYAVLADSTLFLQQLVATIETATAIDAEVMAQRARVLQQLNADYIDFVTDPKDTGEAVCMAQICRFLRQRLPPTTIIANGAGNYTTWSQRHYQFQLAKTQLAPTNGSMGYGVPAAIAAKLARPDAPVVAFSGDGCFLMNGQELATAVQYQLKIIFIVINNNAYGTIRSHQQKNYPARPLATTLRNPDFAALANAYGASGYLVTATAEFETAFEQAWAEQMPALIELRLV